MRALLFETMTGKPLLDLRRSEWSYDTGILAADKLDITVPAATKWARGLDLHALLARDRHSVALIDESVQGQLVVAAAGPIVTATPAEDEDGNPSFKVACRGIERLLEWRHVRNFPGWPLLDAEGIPTGAYDQQLAGLSYGTIMKRLVQESELFAGGALPIEYEADRAGVHERTSYLAVDGRQLLEVLDQLADLADGVEYDFQPRVNELDEVSYRLVTGTDAGRIVRGAAERVWNIGGPQPDLRGYQRAPSAQPYITDAIFAGGKDDDRVLLARASDAAALANGYPRAEVWDSSHSSVSEQGTLDAWAAGAVGGVPDKISFDVRAHAAYGVRHGDVGLLVAQGHWDMPDGEYPVRVLSVARKSSDPDWVSVNLV